MTVLITIVLLMAYIVLGVSFAIIVPLVMGEDYDEEFALLCLILWPFVIGIGLIWGIVKLGGYLFGLISKRR